MSSNTLYAALVDFVSLSLSLVLCPCTIGEVKTKKEKKRTRVGLEKNERNEKERRRKPTGEKERKRKKKEKKTDEWCNDDDAGCVQEDLVSDQNRRAKYIFEHERGETTTDSIVLLCSIDPLMSRYLSGLSIRYDVRARKPFSIQS